MWSKLCEGKSQHYNKRHSGVSSRTNITHLTESSRPISRDSNNLSEELNVPRLLHHNEMTNDIQDGDVVDVEEERLNPRPTHIKHVTIADDKEGDNRPYKETVL